MENFDKIIRIGKGQDGDIFCNIKYNKGKLSITGVIGPKANGDCLGSCGQILDSINVQTLAPGWSENMLQQFLATWETWHLNDMHAGTPAQTAYLKSIKSEYPGYPLSHYDWAISELKKASLQPDPNGPNGGKYSYGSQWLTVAVPDDVLTFLESLPDTDKPPAWV